MENINAAQIENKLIASSFYSVRNLIKKAKQYQGIDLRIMLALDNMYIGHNPKERMTVSLDDLCRRYYLKEKWYKVTPTQRKNVKSHVLKLMSQVQIIMLSFPDEDVPVASFWIGRSVDAEITGEGEDTKILLNAKPILFPNDVVLQHGVSNIFVLHE